MKLGLERYHGLGNDYLVLDPNHNELQLNPRNVAILCNRNMGLGADGILEGPILGEKEISVRIWNPDGSIAKSSGNGLSIFAKYLKDKGYTQKKTYHLVTDGGKVEITYLSDDGNRLRISMGKLLFDSESIPVTGENRLIINEDMVLGSSLYPVSCVSVGNPHCVIPMHEISEEIVRGIGALAEQAKYFPEGINTEIMKVLDKDHIAIETYERGAGYTMATGTGACAAAGVAYRLGLTGPKVIVSMPGGNLQVEIDEGWNVYMTGDVFYIANISLSNEFTEKLRACK